MRMIVVDPLLMFRGAENPMLEHSLNLHQKSIR